MAKQNVPMNGGLRTGTASRMPPRHTAPVNAGSKTGKGAGNPVATIVARSQGKNGGTGC